MVDDARQGAGDELGPIDYLVIEFPDGRMTGEGLALLVDLVDRGTIHVLDLEFVARHADGTTTRIEVADLPHTEGVDLSVFHGSSSGLLDDDDVQAVGATTEPGSVAGVLIYENLWAAPLTAALRRSGARLRSDGRIPLEDMLATLDRVESVSG